MKDRADPTGLLRAWAAGDGSAYERLLPLVYGPLREVAGRVLSHEYHRNAPQPTELIQEVYLRLLDPPRVDWESRAHFFAFAARLMRRILVDQARRRDAAKRGAGAEHVTLTVEVAADEKSEIAILDLERALKELEELHPRPAKIVELKFYGGMTNRETAAALGISEATVRRDWPVARAWLKQALR